MMYVNKDFYVYIQVCYRFFILMCRILVSTGNTYTTASATTKEGEMSSNTEFVVLVDGYGILQLMGMFHLIHGSIYLSKHLIYCKQQIHMTK